VSVPLGVRRDALPDSVSPLAARYKEKAPEAFILGRLTRFTPEGKAIQKPF